MLWPLLAASAVIAAAAAAVVPRRARLGARGLPWFWPAFAILCLAAAGWVGASLGWIDNLGGSARFFWDAFTPGPEGAQFLSHEQFEEMQRQEQLRRWLYLAFAVGAAASAWAWRTRRI